MFFVGSKVGVWIENAMQISVGACIKHVSVIRDIHLLERMFRIWSDAQLFSPTYPLEHLIDVVLRFVHTERQEGVF